MRGNPIKLRLKSTVRKELARLILDFLVLCHLKSMKSKHSFLSLVGVVNIANFTISEMLATIKTD